MFALGETGRDVSNRSFGQCRSAPNATFVSVSQSTTSVQANPRSQHGSSRSCDAVVTGASTGARESAVLRPDRSGRLRAAIPWLTLVIVTIVLYGRGLTQSKGVFGDSFHHLLNGIFIYDAFQDPVSAFSDPLEFGVNYYQHFPAVNLGYYPPVFAIFEAGVMSVFGVSPMAGQLTELLLAVAMALLAYAWLRLRFDRWWAMGTTIAFVSTPMLVFWGQDIMLEVPTVAFMLGAMWGFERIIRAEKPSWSSVILWAVFTNLALWTKQYSLLLLGVFGAGLITTGRWRLFVNPRVLLGGTSILLGAAGIAYMTLKVGGAAVGFTLGHNRQHVADRFNWHQWLFYLRELPDVLTWPTLVLAVVGLVWLIWRWEPYASLLLLWILGFYVMHSYFKGQTARYALLWMPPFFVIASVCLKRLSMHIPLPIKPAWASRGLPVGAAGLVLWAGFSMAAGSMVERPPVPDAYQRMAGELRERLSPFSCLTFFPDQPGRLPVCFRLAIADDTGPPRPLTSYGRVIRAGQVLRRWRDQYPDAQSLDAALRRWNVKYIATETPRPIDRGADDEVVAAGVDGVLALGTFREVRRWPIYWPGHKIDNRTLFLYERIEPMTYDPTSLPPLTLARTAIVLSGSDGAVSP